MDSAEERKSQQPNYIHNSGERKKGKREYSVIRRLIHSNLILYFFNRYNVQKLLQKTHALIITFIKSFSFLIKKKKKSFSFLIKNKIKSFSFRVRLSISRTFPHLYPKSNCQISVHKWNGVPCMSNQPLLKAPDQASFTLGDHLPNLIRLPPLDITFLIFLGQIALSTLSANNTLFNGAKGVMQHTP